MATIMIVDDEPKVRMNLALQVEEQGHRTLVFPGGRPAMDHLQTCRGEGIDALLLDIRMPDLDGLTMVRRLSARKLLPPTIVLSGEASISETVEALQLGVHDFIEKPFSRQRLARSLENCLAHQHLRAEVARLRTGATSTQLIGQSVPMRTLKQAIAKVAPTEARVLIVGESGTGKELVAASIQAQSRRNHAPFIRMNCAALPENLIEDELFGHVKGAFTGAFTDKPGLFESAHSGTLFLDEIGDMPLAMQAKLLRILEDGRVRRLGGTSDRLVDVRILAATHRDLKAMIEKGTFREDLYYRLNSLPISVPPLRERGEDIGLLLDFFLAYHSQQNRVRLKAFHPSARDLLQRYPWPGNIRELRNICERLVILGGDPIMPQDLPADVLQPKASPLEVGPYPAHPQDISLKAFQEQSEKAFIEKVLLRHSWNIADAAASLEIQRTYLYRKIRKLNIQRPSTML